uniref:Uncharacterized protein n=1 Tax=Caenorhabditis japonica TaxID=281687 RepID=A0A8R1DKA2_CAEJA
MKSTYERQLSRMEEEVKMLKSQKLRDHGDPMETGEEPAEQAIEELPEYLQTPQKPNPLRMYSIRKTNQVKIQLDTIPEDRPPRPLSCPPVDSPITWRTRNATSSSSTTVQEPPPSKVPLFGTTGLTKKEKEEPVSTEPTTSATSSLAAPEAIHVECSQEYNEEDLLGEADPSISPILNLDLMEKQLLEEQ